MSIAIACRCKDGVVMGADRRSRDDVRGVLDTTQKIGQIGTHGAFVATGNPTVLTPDAKAVLFSAREVTQAAIPLQSRLVESDLRSVCQTICDSYTAYRLNWPSVPVRDCVFLVPIFYWDQVVRYCLCRIFEHPNVRCEAEVGLAQVVSVYGNPFITDNTAPVFETIRSQVPTSHYDKVTMQEAADLCRAFIRASSERVEQLESNSRFPIGPTSDVALIGADGFKML